MGKRAWILLVFFLFTAFAIYAQSPADTLVPNVDTTTLNDLGSDSDKGIIPNQGFTTNTLLRGLLGLFSLVMIAFLFSANRRSINWRTAGIGLGIQLLLAIGILKVPAIQWFFNILGSFFNEILNFTLAGSQFLFGGLLKQD